MSKVHPIAALFPMMSKDELAELAESIKTNGLLDPIVLDTEERILDGRNREAACKLAKVKPSFETYEGDADAYALAVNLDRRMLTKGQKAMIAARALAVTATPLSRNKTARLVGAGEDRIKKARTILSHAPDLADAVVAGVRSLDDAYEEARKRKADLDSDERKLERLRDSAPDLADAVEEDRLALNEALAAESERLRKQEEQQRDALELLKRVLDLVGDPGQDVAGFTDAWAERLGSVNSNLPQRTARAGQVLARLAERIGE